MSELKKMTKKKLLDMTLVELVESEINDAFRIGQNLEAKRMVAKLKKITGGG